MVLHHTRLWRIYALGLAILPLLSRAEDATPVEPPRRDISRILLPKAFQKNPDLQLTIITEVSLFGKKLPPGEKDHPIYYVARNSGYRAYGRVPVQKRLSESDIDKLLQRSLANSGYLPADAQHQPSLLITYFWGTSYLPDSDINGVFYTDPRPNILERAVLVGGTKFAADLASALRQSADVQDASSTHLSPGDGGTNLGAAQAVAIMNALDDPVKRFQDANPKSEFLLTQSTSDCYYVIASAFDYHSVAVNHRELVWRTRMTVAAQGVGQDLALPTLIAAAGPYFGKDMAESQIIRRLAVRDGTVGVGAPTVVEPPASKPEAK